MEREVKQSGPAYWLRVVLIGRNPKVTVIRIVVLSLLVWLTSVFVFVPIRVQGPSMLPTYQDSGVNFVNRLAFLGREPVRGDVVAIRFSGRHVMLMKRIVALPGETIRFHQGRIHINGEELDEPYMNWEKFPCDWELPPVKLGPDEFYVVGDNRTMPHQQHEFGRAKRDRIVGRILLRNNLIWKSPFGSSEH